uniref:Uncharacterized protein n=1 Tax=Zea mays TaxID=4577 RepID=A0A804MXF4_MAIZE
MAKQQNPIPIPMPLSLSLPLVLVALLLPAARGAAETPQYTTVHAESDFEVRLYGDTVWMSAPTPDIPSFHVATKLGFHRLFQYLMGANLNSSRIRMTTPVLTSVVPGAGPLRSSAYSVRLYLPAKFQASPPVPLPELNLHPDRWPGHCVAARSFSGRARDKNVVEEAEKLAMSLSRSPWANSTDYSSKSAYSVAQYSSPFRIIGRVNEEHVDLKYHISVKNSLRYAIQEMRRQSSLLRTINGLCCSIPEVEGGKVGKLAGHLKEVCKGLEKTSSICQEDLENKCPGWDLHNPPSDVEDNSHPSDVEDAMDGYVSEDPELWQMVFDDLQWEENKVAVSLAEHCRIMGYDYDQMFDRTI